METTTQIRKTNDLRHSILAHDKTGNPIYIKIRLNDECKNGHQDFSITADIYEKGKPKTDKYFICGGCCHEEILKARPDLSIFVNLHLCDYKGIPMYAVENGFYHLTDGFNDLKPTDRLFSAKFCEYYRLTANQFKVLSHSQNKLQYALNLDKLGILAQWEVEANKAIKLLEDWTGSEFIVDSKKTQYHAPTEDELKEEQERQLNGYYTLEAIEQRKIETANKVVAELIAERDKKIAQITEEYDIKLRILEIGGNEALDNCIYYTHSRELSFNWRGYDKISEELINHIKASIALPEGVTFKS